jgi:hypothetical protein
MLRKQKLFSGLMERSALLTAAFIQEIWLWYVIMSSRRRCRGLWNSSAEEQYLGRESQNSSNEEESDGDMNFDVNSKRQVAFSLPTTSKRLAHLESIIRLVKEMTFLEAKYCQIIK